MRSIQGEIHLQLEPDVEVPLHVRSQHGNDHSRTTQHREVEGQLQGLQWDRPASGQAQFMALGWGLEVVCLDYREDRGAAGQLEQ